MKTVKKLHYLFSLLLLLIIGFSCEKDDPAGDEAANANINNWILDNMKTYYFWNDYIPSKTSKNLYPENYFHSLLYKSEDRFSWIQENFTDLLDLLNGVQMEAGYNYTLLSRKEGNDSPIEIGVINYIKPNSPASETELKRGDLFQTINGTPLANLNYGSIINALSAPHTLGIQIEPGQLKNITLSVSKYKENPVFLDTIYNIAGKKIGYLVYNFFAEDDGDKTNTYAKELNAVFGKLKTTGIDELILDFRYNSGGALTTCSELSSMISNRNKNEIFGIIQYNNFLHQYFTEREGSNYNKFYFADNIGNIPINKLQGLNRLYVITSTSTASASEVLINGLKPYMDVILVGDTTYGKNVGSVTIYEENAEKQKTNKWGMQPIVVKLANSQGFSDYGKGFTPDVIISEYEHLPFLPLGDTNEVMLHTTLVTMGVMQASTNLRADKQNTVVPVYSSIDGTPVRRNLYLPRTPQPPKGGAGQRD